MRRFGKSEAFVSVSRPLFTALHILYGQAKLQK